MIARRALKGEVDQTSPWTCVAMSLLAGLSTTLGAGVSLLLPGQHVSRGQMAFALALAGGVMLSVTVLEFWMPLLSGGRSFGPVAFYSGVGALIFVVLSYFAPEPQVVDSAKRFHKPSAGGADVEQDCEEASLAPQGAPIGSPSGGVAEPSPTSRSSSGKLEGEDHVEEEQQRRWRLAAVLMLALTAHNFPEGFAVAISALQSDRLGLVVMFAIAMHNIPEGISIALPVYSATGSRWQALWMSFLSGMAEPLGALTALALVRILGGGLSRDSMENLLCTVGGVMCAVAVKELLPEAWRQKRPLHALAGFTTGFLVMWITSQLGA